jgi:type 1 glutamine amidotransferase
MVNILCIGGTDSPYHSFEPYRQYFANLLKGRGLSATFTEDLDALLPDSIRNFSAIICCVSGKELNNTQEQSLLEAMAGMHQEVYGPPKTFLGIHSAAAAFVRSEAYHHMLGGTFRAHPPLGPFRITIGQDHPISRGLASFEVVDELYILDTRATFTPLFYSTYGEFTIPAGWIKPYGLGRVFYFSPGHTLETLEQQEVRTIIDRAIQWGCGPNLPPAARCR